MKSWLDLHQTRRLTLVPIHHRYVFFGHMNIMVLLDYLLLIRHCSAFKRPLISAPERLFKFLGRRCQLLLLSCCSSLAVFFIIHKILALDGLVTFQKFRLDQPQPRAPTIDIPARIGFAI